VSTGMFVSVCVGDYEPVNTESGPPLKVKAKVDSGTLALDC